MSIFLEIVPAFSGNVVIFFPYAGGMSQSAHIFKRFLPENYGLYSVDYSSKDLQGLSYKNLCSKIIAQLARFINNQTIFIGSSYGAYISYSIVQNFECFQNIEMKKIIMTSVSDVPSLLQGGLKRKLQNNNLIENYQEIPIQMQQEVASSVRRDIEILNGINLLSFKINTAITLWNGKSDLICHQSKTENFWQQQCKGNFLYKTYDGGHIPKHQDWKKILKTI